MYRLVPVHYDPLGLLQPCTEDRRDLWAIYYGHGWIADFSPHAKALANDVCAYLNNRQKIGAILDMIENPKQLTQE
jgi:hypothetical protein